MSVDLSLLRVSRDMAHAGTRTRVRYDRPAGLEADVEIEDEEFYVAARNALIPAIHGGGGMLEDMADMAAQLGAVRLENERLKEHATSIERARAAAVSRLADLEAGRK